MKPMEVVSVFLAVALIIALLQARTIQTGEIAGTIQPGATASNDTLRIIHERKSVRKYTPKAVSREQLEILVKAGMAAPTAANKQPWAFVVVSDKAILEKFAKALPYCKMATQASAAIVVCGDMKLTLPDEGRPYWVQDCSAASENILLAAESMGLGAVWTGLYPISERVKAVQQILNLPQHIVPLNVIPIGYPTGIEKPKDKYKPERIHWQKW